MKSDGLGLDYLGSIRLFHLIAMWLWISYATHRFTAYKTRTLIVPTSRAVRIYTLYVKSLDCVLAPSKCHEG